MATDPLATKSKVYSSSMQPDDDAPSFDEDGQTHMRPGFDEYDMLQTLQHPPTSDPQAALSPQEAYDLMKYSAPLDEGEREILNRTPFLGPELTFVDDADHTEWIMNRSRDKKNAIDYALEDTMYGDDEAGWGLSSLTHAISHAARGIEHGVARGAHSLANVALKFVPGRDARKAALIKQTNARLTNGRANFLQMADVKNGIKNRPRSYYVAQAKPWTRSKLAAGGLPTSFTSGEVAATILGDDTMGSWYNPFSWFQSKVNYVVQNAQGQITEMSQGDFNNWVQQQQAGGGQPNPDGSTTMPDGTVVPPGGQQAAPDQSMMQPGQPNPDGSVSNPDGSTTMPDGTMVPPGGMQAPPDGSQGVWGDLLDGDDSRWERDIDLHHMIENAAHGDGAAKASLQKISKQAAAGSSSAAADMNEIRNYQKETGMSVMGIARKTITDAKYRELTMRAAQRATGSPTPTPAALAAAEKRLRQRLAVKGISVTTAAGEDMMGAWLYKLSPFYWLKSSREQNLIDAEKNKWQQAKDINEQTAKQEKILKTAQNAAYQAQQAKDAQQKSQDVESQLEDIEKSIASGDFVGADPSAALDAAANGKNAARANGKRAGALAAKLESGEKLTPEEVGKLQGCMKMCHHLRKLHDALHGKTEGSSSAVSTSGYHDFKAAKNTQAEFLGSEFQSIDDYDLTNDQLQDVQGEFQDVDNVDLTSSQIQDVQGENVTEILGDNVTEILGPAPSPLLKRHLIAMTAIAATNPAGVAAYAKKNGIRLTAQQVQQIRAGAKLSKAIMQHPAYGQAVLRGDDGTVAGDDSMGFSWTKLITAPLALAAIPAAAIAWGATKVVQAPAQLLKWGAKQGGWYGGSSSSPGAPSAPGGPVGPNPQAIAAAQQRELAAQQRIAAANATSAAAQQQYQANAAAADAEAQAQQAEADAQQSQMDAQRAQYMPGAAPDDASDDSGRVTVLGADFFSGAFVGEIEDPKARKIVEEAQKNTPTGKKIRAGATLYGKARRGHKKSRLAIAKMQAKAKAGDPQAQRDMNAVKAGKIAIHARGHAHRKIALKARREAANKKGIAVRKHLEAAAGKRLGEHTRRKKLAHIAKVEAAYAKGHPKAKIAVAKAVTRARAGDHKAKATVAALKLARHVRLAGRTPAERKRLHAAQKVVYKARHGHKTSIRQIALINAAAKKGQPNAVRARKRLVVAARVEHAVATGHIATPTSKHARRLAAHKHVLHVKNRVAMKVASREEALSGAKAAHAIGDRKSAADLALSASGLPSAKDPIKKAAAIAAAANNGSPQAQKHIDDTLAKAKEGDPKAISDAGNLAAAQAVDAVNKDKPMPKPVAEATLILDRAKAGDEEAKRTIQRAGAAAQDPNHPDHDKGVEAAVALSAAAVTTAALAANAGAAKKWKDAAKDATGTTIPSAEHAEAHGELADLTSKLHEGTATYAEGVRARNLAVALDQPKLAAQISAIMPPPDFIDTPMSTLPDAPEPAISGPFELLKESVKALALATSDPFGNYREGVRSRGNG